MAPAGLTKLGFKIAGEQFSGCNGTVNVAVARETVDIGIDTVVGCFVGRRSHVTGATEALLRLFEQAVVLTAVRIVALGAPAAVGHVTIDGSVFIQERPGLLGMTTLAGGGKSKHLILIGPFHEPVTAQAGYGAGSYWMRATAGKLRHCVLMTFPAEISIAVDQQ